MENEIRLDLSDEKPSRRPLPVGNVIANNMTQPVLWNIRGLRDNDPTRVTCQNVFDICFYPLAFVAFLLCIAIVLFLGGLFTCNVWRPFCFINDVD